MRLSVDSKGESGNRIDLVMSLVNDSEAWGECPKGVTC